MPVPESAETILIVDDQEPVCRTFREWLEGADLGCRILTAGDAARALELANRHTIDLAILDWHLGAGHDGLQLLEDLVEFNPEVVAIMVTGFAHQATPLMAMRMGVRDYLDKNHELSRDTFLAAVRKQLARIRPARRERQLNHGLAAFHSAVERVLPLVQTSQALHDPVPLPVAIQGLFAFLLRTTGAADGVLLVHSYDADRQPVEVSRAYDAGGQALDAPLVSFARSLAGSVATMQEAHALTDPERLAREGTIDLQPFERGRRNVLAAPINVTPGVQVVLELFDKPDPAGFTAQDRQFAQAAATFGGDLLRQALAERQTQRVLFDAVAAALRAGDEVAQALRGGAARPEEPPADVLAKLHEGLRGSAAEGIDAAATLRLAEAVRVLALRYGPGAVEHCTRLVEGVRDLLDEATGAGGETRG
jgi:ActR/RegA family two-component response regulator